MRIQTRCRLAGRVNAAPIGRPLCRSGIHTTHRARGFTGGGSDRVSRPDLVGDGRRATNGWRLVQHCCHRAAAWSSAGVLADGHARRAGRSRASRAAARAIRRLPRRAAPSTHLPIGTLTHGLCVCLAAAHRRRPQVRRWLTRERRQRWSDRRLCGASASARAPKKGGWTERAALGHRTALEWLQIMVSGIYDCQSTVG